MLQNMNNSLLRCADIVTFGIFLLRCVAPKRELKFWRIYCFVILLMMSCFEIDEIQSQMCSATERDGLNMVDCSNKDILLVPYSALNNVQFLDLSGNSKLRFSPDSFDTYMYTLLRLRISHVTDVNMQRSIGVAPLDIFSKLEKLQVLEFTYSQLTDEEMWQLPASLRKYNVDGNEYTYLDVSMCPELEELSANDNKLKRMPALSHPPPPIEALYLKNNLMDDLTVHDIAPLCNLKKLKLELPSNTFLYHPSGSCRCMQLDRWIDVFGISGAELNCDLGDVMTCDLSLIEVKDLRQACTDSYLLPIQSKSWIKMILGASIGLCFLSGLAFIIYKYTDSVSLPGENVVKDISADMKTEEAEEVLEEESE